MNFNEDNLFRFIEDQTNLSTSWHAKMDFTLNELIYNILPGSSLQKIMKEKFTKHGRWCVQNNQPMTESQVELEDDSTIDLS